MRAVIVILIITQSLAGFAQTVIPLYDGKPPGSESWDWQEDEMFSEAWGTRVVYNVSRPTLTAYLPTAHQANGTAVIICPGGGFRALSIDREGIDLAKWLNTKGVAAFVLRYRLMKSNTKDPVKEMMTDVGGGQSLEQRIAPVIPMAVADGLRALEILKRDHEKYNINPNRIGMIGFSAGGTVATGVVLKSTESNAPDFAAPIYAFVPPSMGQEALPEHAPPAFIVAASDDQLNLAPHSIDLYNKWMKAGKSAELHMYSTGGHGFGVGTQYLPSDSWVERFGEWLEVQGLFQRETSAQASSPKDVVKRRKEADERFRKDWANLARFKEENTRLAPPKQGEKRVVFMGNSITAGWINQRPEFFEGKPYVNRGISGQTTPQMLIRFNQDVIDLKPSVVVILAGINDIAQNTGPTTPEAIMDNISSMALLAKSHGIKVVLSSVLPAYDFPWRPGLEPAQKVVQLNKMIKAFAADQNIVYLDYFSALVDSRNGMKKEYATDEVHPTVAGYKVMEPLVEKAIAQALQK